MKKLILILALALGLPLLASIGVFYDPSSAGVTNRVVSINRSFDTAKAGEFLNVLIAEPADILTNLPSDLKVDGTNVVLLTQADQDAIAAAQAAAALAAQQFAERDAKTNAYEALDAFLGTWEGRLLRAQLETLVDEINSLRTQQAFLLMELNKAKANITSWRNEAAFATNGWPARTMGQARTAIIGKLDTQPDNN